MSLQLTNNSLCTVPDIIKFTYYHCTSIDQAWGQVLWYLYLSTLSTASKVLVLILKSFFY